MGAEIGYQDSTTLHYYDDPILMLDAYYTYLTMSGIRNIIPTHPLLIGVDTNFVIYS